MPAMYGQSGTYFGAMDPNKPAGSIQWANAYLGATTSIEPGKAMKDLLSLPSSGIENVELSVIDPQKFEVIPREMFAEARRLGKMLIRDFTKDGRPTPISLHAPLLEATGFTENRWDETSWKSTQQQLGGVVEKAAMLGPRAPVNMHASQVFSEQIRYDPVDAKKYLNMMQSYAERIKKIDPNYLKEQDETVKMLQRNEVPMMMAAVDPVSHELKHLPAEVRQLVPGEPHFMSPQERINEQNRSTWQSQQQQLAGYEAELNRIMSMYNQSTNANEKARLKKIAEIQEETLHTGAATLFEHAFRADPKIAKRPEVAEALKKRDYVEAIMSISSNQPPELIQPFEKFAREKAADTFASAAMRSYEIASAPEKYLSKDEAKGIRAAGIKGWADAPIITIENVSPEMAFGRGESLKNLVEESRKHFEKQLIEKKLPEAKAHEIATKLIGATWDVGHINLLKKYGYTDQQIAAEIKNLAPFVKHVHITDNFGSYDAHLAPGMGNVPIQDILKHLQKDGKMPPNMRGIVEAGGYVMSYGENPIVKTMQYFNMPAYGFQGSPTWGGESPVAGGYFMGSSAYSAGYGLMLPPIHYSEYGAGFTGLPPSLAAVPGTAQRSQFAGTPNA